MSAVAERAAIAPAVRGYWRTVALRLGRDRLTILCLLVLLLILLSAILAPEIAPYDPTRANMVMRLQPLFTPGHLLGTDELGRDMLTRLMFGGRMSLLMGFVPVALALLIGGGLGVVAGFLGGIVNSAIMRTMDVFYAFPSILLAVAISGALGAGMANALLSLTVVFVPPITRVAESVTTSVRGLDYVEAARATGAGTFMVVRAHVLRNVLGPVFVYASSLVSVSIILASGLSFLGLGVRPPDAEWGLMLNTLRQALWINPTLAALPGGMIFVTSLCCNLLSDGLRTAMEIRQ